MSYLSLKNINKVYPGDVQAVFDFCLEADQGEFIVLVGPSGCGKSTVLRMIAGLEAISGGDMLLNEKRINDMAPSDRNIAMVFQDYALYGNMTVYHNIGFSLTIRGEKEARIHEKVMDVSKTVGLYDYLNRYPKALSGGQKQRVAMGRSIAKEAGILLMDEPLSNLDAKLRQQTRQELSALHHELSSTILYVTHDQIEAMTLASRIVVMNEGHIQQIGTPYEIYHTPANIFTASFIGSPGINLMKGAVEGDHFTGMNREEKPVLNFRIPRKFLKPLEDYRKGGLVMGLRPESIYTEKKESTGGEDYSFNTVVNTLELLGAEYNAGLDVGGFNLSCRISADQAIGKGQNVTASFDVNKVHFFDEKTGLRIKGQE
ncbi:putative ABC transporter ATP-binding protein YcjV [Spirochaetia bacterium]|nr:putative ABC transporter ATP-binding protein YcjV [Spirochaetia bacterium]